MECDEYNEINPGYLQQILHSASFDITGTGIDIITDMKGYTFQGRVDPGTALRFTLCLQRGIFHVEEGEYAVSGINNDGTTYYANDGRVLVPDICACNISIFTLPPTDEPTLEPTRSPTTKNPTRTPTTAQPTTKRPTSYVFLFFIFFFLCFFWFAYDIL